MSYKKDNVSNYSALLLTVNMIEQSVHDVLTINNGGGNFVFQL